MPQIAIIQTPSPQAPPAAPPSAARENDSFSPHLDKAMSSRQQQSVNRDKLSEEATSLGTQNDKSYKEINDSAIHLSPEEEISSNQATNHAVQDNLLNNTMIENLSQSYNLAINPAIREIFQDNTTSPNSMQQEANQTIDLADPKNLINDAAMPVSDLQDSNNSPLFLYIVNALQADIRPRNDQQIGSTPVSLIKSPAEGDTQTNALITSLTEQLGETSTDTFTPLQAPQSQGVKQERDAILAQLQKIIENSGEYGKLSIKINGSTLKVMPGAAGYQMPVPTAGSPDDALPLAATATTDFVEVSIGSAGNILPINPEVPTDKANQNLNSVRHTIQQQYYDGKMILQEGQEKEATSQDNRQNETFMANTAATGESGLAPAVATDPTSTFTQPLASIQEGQKLPTVETSRPVTLPSGTLVHQEEVIRQIAERFQISRRDLDTRVNIQLHPAELGELKIDLTVKDGTISANIVANSQYTQEIIERNMAKLRTVLEGQGFTIDDITVTAKSESADDFNLFDQQLFSRNDYTPPAAKSVGNSETLFSLDTLDIYPQPAAISNINVKI